MVISIDSSGTDGSWKRRPSGIVTAIEKKQVGAVEKVRANAM